MKKQVPLLIGTLVGLFALFEYYIPANGVREVKTTLEGWALVLAAAAYVLGAINIIQVNVPRIRRRDKDWQYKVVLLSAAGVMALAGVAWHTFGGQRASGTISLAAEPAADGQAYVRVVPTHDEAVISVNKGEPMQASDWRKLPDMQVPVPAGQEVAVQVFMPPQVTGYEDFNATVRLEPGEIAVVETDLVLLWGKEGRVYTWLYNHVFDPCNATMFALLAFFIASAAFRAFRARNTEAALLLGSAILVMIGRAPVGGMIHDFFPDLAEWILSIPNNAGRRAIMMGAALGAIVTGLRVILGLERSHLGAD